MPGHLDTSQPGPLVGCYIKLLRAREHLTTLRETIDSLGPHPYEIVEERNLQTLDRDFRLVGTADIQVFRRRIPMLPVIVGDVIHQVRSSLDHAVWQIAKPAIEKKTAFPICLHESGSGSTFYGSSKEPGVGLRCLKNVSQPAFEYIESIQPYKRLGEQDELWLLDELWNKDKHRALIVLDRPTWRDTFIISTANGRDLYDGEIKPNPTDDPDILLRLDSKSDSEVSFNPNPPLHVNFGEAGPLNGRAVVQVLVELHRYVTGIVLPGLERFV
jgi:hypothetical protein